jgi:glycerate kinase
MNILIAPDSFKDSLSAKLVAENLKKGLVCSLPTAKIKILPLADGGEGTLDALDNSFKKITYKAVDALSRPIESYYLIHDNIAYIEMAQTAGLEQIEPELRNPLKASSRGVGLQIKHAIALGVQKIVLFVGGSATNDAGVGMASELGYTFWDKNDKVLSADGENLLEIHRYTFSQKPFDIAFTVATDVENPFYGPNGAAWVYAPQKGATEDDVALLDKGMESLAAIIQKNTGLDLQQIPGTGAAGGLAGGAVAFLGAKVVSAAELIFEITDLSTHLKNADVIITGEGKVDQQTWNGKLISKLIKAAKNKKMIIIGGSINTDLSQFENIIAQFAIKTEDMELEFAKTNAAELIYKKGVEIGAMLK